MGVTSLHKDYENSPDCCSFFFGISYVQLQLYSLAIFLNPWFLMNALSHLKKQKNKQKIMLPLATQDILYYSYHFLQIVRMQYFSMLHDALLPCLILL